MMPKYFARFFFLITYAALAGAQQPPQDNSAPSPSSAAASTDSAGTQADASAGEEEKKKRDKEKKERRPIETGAETTVPQTVADAPLPPQGEPTPKPTFERGPLSLRQDEFSLGLDHLLSPDLAVGGLLGYSRGKLHRFQTTIFDGIPGDTNDTTIKTRARSGALILSWFPAPGVFVDTALSYAHTSFHVDRLVNDLITFSGDTSGRGYGVSVNGGYVARFGALAVIPQAGLEYIDARVNGFRIVAVPEGSTSPDDVFKIDIADQRLKTLNGTIGGQVQWANSVPFGTLTPYVRAQYRHRLSSSGNIVRTSADGADDVLVDPADTNPGKHLTTLGLGLLAQFEHGVSAFIDYGESVGGGDLRLRKLALGLRFEY